MDTEPSLPVSFPIKTLKDLEHGTYYKSFHFMFNKSTVPLKGVATAKAKRPRLLACHDYKGGYLDDQWIQGSENGSAYTLTNWRLLDIFIYFSHNLVTLPPPSWVNAAHRHGVQVLGTFITEWDDGYAICQELCATEGRAIMYASLLAELAQALGFDGWLVNIENKVIDLVPNLKVFVGQLTDSMHAWVPGSTVIWYDSVTVDGSLRWQNRLNDKNIPFFDISDSFFTNYSWQKEYAKESGDLAGEHRRFDVYMGVDVFGRNTYGGGGYQCDVALKAAREAEVSAALFAPGWTYENNKDDHRWWRLIEDCWSDARVDPVQLPFFTDFDVGHGRATFIEGRQVSELPWSNLSCQSLQPLLHVEASSLKQVIITSSRDPPIYSGGSSIHMIGDINTDELCLYQLYRTAVHVEDVHYETSLDVSYSVLVESSSKFALVLKTEDHLGACSIHFLLEMDEEDNNATSITKYEIGHTSVIFDCSRRKGECGTSADTGAEAEGTESDSSKSWSNREYTLAKEKFTITGIFGVCSTAEDLKPLLIKLLHENESVFEPGNFLVQEKEKDEDAQTEEIKATYRAVLGHISFANSSHDCHFSNKDQRFVGTNMSWAEGNAGEKFVSVKLVWRGHVHKFTWERFHVYAKTKQEEVPLQYLGMAMVEAFYVYELAVSKEATPVTFYLQPQCSCGKVQELSTCPTYKIDVPLPSSAVWMRPQPSLKDWLFV
ncbi:hypothetical protein Mapa_014021 [Marchantia paleacea]|nr:hypothetical protein Mapa_014021 [Marchantia paleacea]